MSEMTVKPADTTPEVDPAEAVPVEADLAAELIDVSQVFQTAHGPFTAIKDVNLAVPRGEFLTIVGPSGCGKSTLVGIISGLAPPASGQAKVFGEPVRGVNRRIGVIFQRDALLPWRTALDNVAMPLRFRKVRRAEADRRAKDWLARVGLAKFASSYPHQLSGGMRKRVAIAATMAYEPDLLLMDEPFSALDVQTRNLMENDLLDLWSGSGQTVIFITHDLEEAVGLSDRVVTLTASPGTVRSEHTVDLRRPRDLLEDRLRPDFAEIYASIWADLRGDVMRAHDQQEQSELEGAVDD